MTHDPPDAVLAPTRYRWLTQGEAYRYSAAPGKGLDVRRGSLCRVVTLPRPGSKPANTLVEFEDGVQHVVPSGVLKRKKEGIQSDAMRSMSSDHSFSIHAATASEAACRS